jgi:hypothetical protein
MHGKYFDSKIEQISSTLPRSVSVEDVELMYTLLLAARGIVDVVNLSEDEEKLALGAFCWFHWPNKPPSYIAPARTLVSHFGGIAQKPSLQGKFKARISPLYMNADVKSILNGDIAISTVFQILRKVRTQAMRAAAREFRLSLPARSNRT